MHYQTFDSSVPLQLRAQAIATVVNKCIDDFEAAGGDGVETFSEQLVSRVEKAGLCKKQWMDVEVICIHPDNREGSLAVPIDVHDLLLVIGGHNGWSWKRCSILGGEIPDGPIGDEWKKKNVEFQKSSDGLIPAFNTSLLKVATARGTHTVSVLRCIKFGAKGIHPEVCLDGVVSRSKIVTRHPSMEEPLEKGVPVDVIAKELVLACPRLMEVLSRVDNQHAVGRMQTQLQNCNRLHKLAMRSDLTDEKILKLACIGLGPDFLNSARSLLEFVRSWAGGEKGQIFQDLERYEKSLKVKRKLYAADLKALAAIDPVGLERYVPAMIKASLNAPPGFVDEVGYSTLFPANGADISSLIGAGKQRPFAIEATKLMREWASFLEAYGHRIEGKDKLVTELEVRCVMHVHQKKSDTRQSFVSLVAIANTSYQEAKKEDNLLPKWSRTETVPEASSSKEEKKTNPARIALRWRCY